MAQPKGLFVLSGTEMGERFSFYVLHSILALFMVDVLHFDLAFASLVFGLVLASTSILQIFGGYITDKCVGNRKAIYLGGILMMISQFIIAFSASLYASSANIPVHSSFIFTFQENMFIIGIIILAIGSSFFKASIFSLVGLLYDSNDSRMDSGYTIFYMAINIGGLLATLVAAIVVGEGHPELFQYGFLISGIFLALSLLFFTYFKDKYIISSTGTPVGVVPLVNDEKFLAQRETSNISDKLSKIEIDRIYVIVLLSIMSIIFFIGFEQEASSMIFFIKQSVNSLIPVVNIDLSPQSFLSINPLAIMILAPIFVELWAILDRRNKEPSIVAKIGIGLIVLAIAYIVLGIGFAMVENSGLKAPILCVITFYVLITVSELLISPVGLSLVIKLAPPKYTSSFMGLWFVAMAIGDSLAGYFAGFYPDSTKYAVKYFLGFIPIDNLISFGGLFVVTSLIFGITCLLFKNKIIKLMHGVK